jgi:predicted RNA-binding protein
MRDNIETNYLIFIASDGKKSGIDIFNDRLKENKWPIYNKTPQLLNVVQGRRVLFYIAGNGEKSQCFIASAEIKNIIENNKAEIDPNKEFKQVLLYVQFENLKIFNTEINVKDHIDNLNFIKNKKHYGLYFQGGICKISEQSYEYITNI